MHYFQKTFDLHLRESFVSASVNAGNLELQEEVQMVHNYKGDNFVLLVTMCNHKVTLWVMIVIPEGKPLSRGDAIRL